MLGAVDLFKHWEYLLAKKLRCQQMVSGLFLLFFISCNYSNMLCVNRGWQVYDHFLEITFSTCFGIVLVLFFLSQPVFN